MQKSRLHSQWVGLRCADDDFASETIPQAWYRWLYHLRPDPPTVSELHGEVKDTIAMQHRIREV